MFWNIFINISRVKKIYSFKKILHFQLHWLYTNKTYVLKIILKTPNHDISCLGSCRQILLATYLYNIYSIQYHLETLKKCQLTKIKNFWNCYNAKMKLRNFNYIFGYIPYHSGGWNFLYFHRAHFITFFITASTPFKKKKVPLLIFNRINTYSDMYNSNKSI